MPRPRRPGRSRLILTTLVLVSLVLVTVSYKDTAPVRSVRSGASTVFSPLQSAGETVASPFRGVWHGATDYDRVKKENARLKDRLDKIKGNQARVDSLERDNKALRRDANVKFAASTPLLGAQVIQGPLSNFDHTIQINVGSGDGVRAGMPVVTNAGMVGKILRVYGDKSSVQLITDPGFKMGVSLMIEKLAPVVAHGDGPDSPLVVDGGVPVVQDVPKGTLVESSGIDRSAFPPHVPVGTVKSTKQSADATEKSITITPYADLHSLTYVQVMLYDAPG